MPEPRGYEQHRQTNEVPPGDQTVDVQATEVRTSTYQQSVKKLGFKFWAVNISIVILSVTAWEKIALPSYHFFYPEYSMVSTELGNEVADLLESSKKNCSMGNYDRRGCKAIWAGIRIPSFTAGAQ